MIDGIVSFEFAFTRGHELLVTDGLADGFLGGTEGTVEGVGDLVRHVGWGFLVLGEG